LFRWWVRGYLRKHFHAVRLSRGTRPDVAPDLPLIVVLNHPSWWDPLVGIVLAGLFPEHAHYAPMEADTLGRYSLFSKLGFYGLDRGTPRGAVAFLRATTAILSQPRSAVWITAQGRFTDPRVRPTLLRPGVGHLARRLDEGLILTLALEYVFWEERLPEALCRFGEPIWIGKDQGLRVSEWVERIQGSLTSAQDALRDAALSRDPTGFETLLLGKVAIGGIYDLGRRSRAWLRGERFRPEHGSEGERP
jgi:1-acyl-sn-glycerol-3-phosphate acyltransferase